MDRRRIEKLGKQRINNQSKTKMQPRKLLIALTAMVLMWSCGEEEKRPLEEPLQTFVEPEEIKEFGFTLNDFVVKRDTIKSGDSFGVILESNNLGYPKIFHIAEKAKDTFDIRKLQVGKPYTILCAKDSLQTPETFIYQPNKEEYVVINFRDSIHAYTSRKPITYVEKELSGVINSSISETLEEKGIRPRLAFKLADDIYAWTIDFRRLQKIEPFIFVGKKSNFY